VQGLAKGQLQTRQVPEDSDTSYPCYRQEILLLHSGTLEEVEDYPDKS
jgi:hypothetical protein